MRKRIMGTAFVLSLTLAGTASADAGIPVQSLTGDWSASNSTVHKTPEGVHFGTYANGAAIGGSMLYKGANGLTLSDVDDFSFAYKYNQAGSTTGAAPYARIWLDTNEDGVWTNGPDKSVMFDPSMGGIVTPAKSTDLTFGTADDSVRYADDAGSGAQKTWDEVAGAHGTERIIMVGVSQGFSDGTDVSAMLKSITLNGKTFAFNVAPADGATGPKGDTGATGAAGPAGKDGVTTIVRERTVTGARLRTLHVKKIAGMKFVSAHASLRGKSIPTIRGRTIKVDLRGKSVGRYRVFITAKYKADGKVYKVRSIRNLSIANR